eukprot:m.31805 g.31805  ORF g.31805 m.31805 type:complete len:453 (+) comp6336_c0_seq1:74-1432(+)
MAPRTPQIARGCGLVLVIAVVVCNVLILVQWRLYGMPKNARSSEMKRSSSKSESEPVVVTQHHNSHINNHIAVNNNDNDNKQNRENGKNILVNEWKSLLAKEEERDSPISVEIWSKASIGEYFQESIMGSVIEPKLNGVWFRSESTCTSDHKFKFTYRGGQGVIPQKVPKDTKHVVLILQARSDVQASEVRVWLDLIPSLPNVENVGVVLLAEEGCENLWFKSYLENTQSFKIRFVFMVYGGKDWIDNKRVFQWPLGVATYRKFPQSISRFDALGPTTTGLRRKYLCNLQATIYEGSSREKLLSILRQSGLDKHCFINARTRWLAHETVQTAEEYKNILLQSDFTLSPIGQNTECYRHYEAIVAGSIPIVEDVIQPESCGTNPIQLLKDHNAPFIFIKSWDDLPTILKHEMRRTPLEMHERRRSLLDWYETFKLQMKNRFCNTLSVNFNHLD